MSRHEGIPSTHSVVGRLRLCLFGRGEPVSRGHGGLRASRALPLGEWPPWPQGTGPDATLIHISLINCMLSATRSVSISGV